jgi:hypothetical protein
VSWVILINVFPWIFFRGRHILGLGFNILSLNLIANIGILHYWNDMIFTGFGAGRTFFLHLIDLIILEFDDVLMGFFRFRFEECCDVV